MPRWLKVVLVVLGAIALFAFVLSFFGSTDDSDREITFSEMIAAGREGDIERIEIYGARLEIKIVGDPDEWQSHMGFDTDLSAALAAEDIEVGGDSGIELDFSGDSSGAAWVLKVLDFLPLVILVAFYYAIRNAVREGIRRADRDAGR